MELLFKIMNEITALFESSNSAGELILGLKNLFRRFGDVKDLKIYTKDEILHSLKNFAKPWENIIDKEIENKFNELYSSGNDFIKTENKLFFPLYFQRKINGIVEIEGNIEINGEIMQLLSRQISIAVLHLKYYENAKNNAKFYETIRNIAKITETQYDLSYILPIMGEIIDGFISEHLIYIFLKKPGKKEFKLVWPNKCLINNISGYLKEVTPKEVLIKENGRVSIFPLKEGSKIQGAIVAYNSMGILNKNEIEYLEQLTNQASITVNRAKEYMKILQNATLDALTGLNNRHLFYQRLDEAVANAKRQKTDLCCIMTDVDFFKSVNDKYGHAAGDMVLKTVAKTIKKELRQYDIPSRYGGEEFAILLPNTPLDEAVKVAQRLRSRIEKKKIDIGKKEISVTISIGVAIYDINMKDPCELYKKADKGLYIAKESGRNRVVPV